MFLSFKFRTASIPFGDKQLVGVIRAIHGSETARSIVYKRRLAVEMFKVTHGLNDGLSPFIQIMESRRKGELMAVPRKKMDLGRNSLFF